MIGIYSTFVSASTIAYKLSAIVVMIWVSRTQFLLGKIKNLLGRL